MTDFNIERGSIFAKILAAENIVVDQKTDVDTAYFDVKNRVLVVPKWNVSETLYDMLLLHECSHAIYTPPKEWVDAIEAKPEEERSAFQSYLNVIEDARIDRLIQLKYPGAQRYYIRGTRELNKRDFFGLSKYNGDYSKLQIIDKINVYYKATKYHDDLDMPYSDDEKGWIEKVAKVRTFAEVIKLAEELFEQTKHALPKTKISKINISVDGFDSDKGSSGQKIDPNSELGKKLIEALKGSETLDKLKESIKKTSPSKSKQSVHNYEHNNQIFNVVSYPINKIVATINDRQLSATSSMFSTVHRQGLSVVNYMASVFERRKRARDFKKVQESKTGVLDTNRLHQIFHNEDVFLTKMVVPECKNHGFIFLLDCSGSMSGIFKTALMQLFTLVSFCKKTSIPFEVYGFTDGRTAFNSGLFNGKLGGQFKLIEIATSKMTLKKIIKNFDAVSNISLSGTPLSEAILGLIPIAEKFRQTHRIDKLNIISLTDGGCTNRNRYKAIVDRKTGTYYSTGANICNGTDNTSALYKVLKARTNANIVAYFVVDNYSQINYYVDSSVKNKETYDGFVKVTNWGGVDTCYYIDKKSLTFKVLNENSTFNQRTNITKNRVLTDKFIESIS